jgi:hypothetical protein
MEDTLRTLQISNLAKNSSEINERNTYHAPEENSVTPLGLHTDSSFHFTPAATIFISYLMQKKTVIHQDPSGDYSKKALSSISEGFTP